MSRQNSVLFPGGFSVENLCLNRFAAVPPMVMSRSMYERKKFHDFRAGVVIAGTIVVIDTGLPPRSPPSSTAALPSGLIDFCFAPPAATNPRQRLPPVFSNAAGRRRRVGFVRSKWSHCKLSGASAAALASPVAGRRRNVSSDVGVAPCRRSRRWEIQT